MANEFTRPTKAWDLNWVNGSPPEARPEQLHCREREKSPLPVRPNAFVAEAVHEMVSGKLAAVQVGPGLYASEQTDEISRQSVIACFNVNGNLQASIVKANGNYRQLPEIGAQGDTFDQTPLYACFILAMAEKYPTAKEILDEIREEWKRDGTYHPEHVYRLSDFIDYAFEEGLLKPKITGGHIDTLDQELVSAGTFDGDVIFGTPFLLRGKAKRAVSRKKKTVFRDAAAEFSAFARSHSWTEEERKLIPTFPDDYAVLPEVLTIARRYVQSRSFRRPMVNVMWRADTSYGKSTGVEMLAAILGLPLLRLTCHSTMEKNEFLTQFVPVTGNREEQGPAPDLPSFEEISFDPETAYRQIAGVSSEEATPELCLQAIARRSAVDPLFRVSAAKASLDEALTRYRILAEDGTAPDGEKTAERARALQTAQEDLTQALEAVRSGAAGCDSAPRFQLVESNFIRSLQKGYLCEVQEVSRIRDSGVLVGLNEYDRPGSVIPMVDGTFCTRHPEAFVVFTDNVGYTSCRPVDPSVIRRMAFVIDSPDLPEKEIKDRVRYNTGFAETALLDRMYTVWKEIRSFCRKHEYTDGTCSATELEMWVSSVMIDGMADLEQTCRECVVSKCTSDPDEQAEIMSSVVKVHLA